MDGLMMKYFVLKPKGNNPYARASRMAMRVYADHIRSTNPELCYNLNEWVNREQEEANAAIALEVKP